MSFIVVRERQAERESIASDILIRELYQIRGGGGAIISLDRGGVHLLNTIFFTYLPPFVMHFLGAFWLFG